MNNPTLDISSLTLNGDRIREAMYQSLSNVINDARHAAKNRATTGALSSEEDIAVCMLLLKGLHP